MVGRKVSCFARLRTEFLLQSIICGPRLRKKFRAVVVITPCASSKQQLSDYSCFHPNSHCFVPPNTPQIETATLSDRNITAISPGTITRAIMLAHLDLSCNAITDVAPLATLHSLRHLNLAANAIQSLASLKFKAIPQPLDPFHGAWDAAVESGEATARP